jgi:translation initiation factor 5A
MVIKGRPCKVSHVSTSKTGKHGHAKCNFTAIDIFNGKKYEDIIPSTHNTTVPVVDRKEYSIIDIAEDGFCTLLNEAGETREDIKLPDVPETFGREIKAAFDSGKSLMVTVLKAMGHEQIIAMKEEATA